MRPVRALPAGGAAAVARGGVVADLAGVRLGLARAAKGAQCGHTMSAIRKRPQFKTTLDPSLLARLRAHSEQSGEALSRLIDRAIRKLLAAEERRANVANAPGAST